MSVILSPELLPLPQIQQFTNNFIICKLSYRMGFVSCGLYKKAMLHQSILCLMQLFDILRVPRYMYGYPLGLQEVETSRNARQSSRESDKIVSSTHRPPLPRGNHFC
jgi:hypothetical protein